MDDKNHWTRPWWVWVMPLLSLGFASYLLYTYIDWSRFEARIAFEEAEGIEPGKTKVKYRGVNVGKVTGVTLSSNTTTVIVKAHLDRKLKPLLKEGGTFWLIKPDITLDRIQGMGTLFAGSYLEFQPSQRMKDDAFVGIPRAPRATDLFDGLTFKLRTANLQSFKIGNPLTYRGIRVGAVTGFRLTSDAREAELDIKIQQDYAHLVRDNSMFWEASGIQADLGLLGAEISIPTMDALLSGGIAFATPPAPGPRIKAGHTFPLQSKVKDEWLKWSPPLTPNNRN